MLIINKIFNRIIGLFKEPKPIVEEIRERGG